LQEIDWDKGDKVTAQLGSLMDQGKCLLLHFMFCVRIMI